MLKSGKFNDVDVITGFTSGDGILFLISLDLTKVLQNGISRSTFIDKIQKSRFVRDQNDVINEAMEWLYTDWYNVTDPITNCRMLLKMATDAMFIAPTIATANAIAKKTSKIFMYQFTFMDFNYTFWRPNFRPVPSWVGAFHASDVGFVLGKPFATNSSVYTKEGNFSRTMIKMWSNFAKSG